MGVVDWLSELEVERLRAANEYLSAECHRKFGEIERLRAALAFYASARVSTPTPGAPFSNCDDGAHARAVLGGSVCP